MKKAPMLMLALGIIAAASAQAGDRLKISTQVVAAGAIVSSSSREIDDGGTAHFSDGQFKEIETKVTVNCRTGINRWLNLFEPACDKPIIAKEQRPIGFNAEITAKTTSDGFVLLKVDGDYVQVLADRILAGGGADLHTADFRVTGLKSQSHNVFGAKLRIGNLAPPEDVVLTVEVVRL